MTMGNFLYLSSLWTPMVMSFFIASGFLCSHGQTNSRGFISIDCGYTTSTEYTDHKTGLTYVADVGFTDAGLIQTVDLGNMPNVPQRYRTVCFFPNGTRSCYKLRSLTPGGKNSVRAAFGYGNYDALNRPPAFDLYLGVNYWTTVNITNASRAYVFDTSAVSPAEYLHICLVNIGLGDPFISGLELRPPNESSTDSLDANAMMAIQANYFVKRNWEGDPCAPAAFAWDGLNCSYSTPSGSPGITALNLSFSGLIGEIDASFGQLALLQHLDLSHNNLSGSIPDILGQISSLTFLDLSSNNLSGTVPTSLQEKSDSGVVLLKTGNNPNQCTNHTCDPIANQKKKKTKLEVILGPVGAAIALLLVALPVLVIWNRRRKRQDVPLVANPFENRRFKYTDLEAITNGFKNVIGKGGYGLVYIGYLEDKTAVAVKVESQTSSQGNNEFLAEVHHLTRVHHRNLVPLIGYCEDKKHRCLVYEYMDGGNLEDRLRGQQDAPIEPLTWLQRLNIALGSASGLEYLHKSCSPPLIHRDVKTRNILLNANLEAKISDFGLTRAFSSETDTHTITQPAGTVGYLDPEYYTTSRLSEKSDVYSFGVVLLVLITAKPAIITINDTEVNITQGVREWLSRGGIESITDPRIRGDCDLNSVRKVAELALHCTRPARQDRPTMTEVVAELREILQLELSSRSMRCSSVGSSGSAFADAESIGVLEVEQIVETSRN